jgi:uncharacterized damage-inducible protein DinB
MFSAEMLTTLFRHMEWADAKVWAIVPAAGTPDEDLRWRLTHVHVVQRAFLHIWTNRPVAEAFRRPDEFTTLAEIRAWARPYYQEARAFVQTLNADRLAEAVHLPWAGELTTTLGRPPDAATLADTCFQVTSHSTYHRGQVNARLRQIGVEPPLVDYIAWVWLGRPAPEWRG